MKSKKRPNSYKNFFPSLLLSHIIILMPILMVSSYLFPYEMRNPLSESPPPPGTIWPRPNGQNSSQKYFSLDSTHLKINIYNLQQSEIINCSVLNWAISHYTQLIRQLPNLETKVHNNNNKTTTMKCPHPEMIKELRIELKSCQDDYPSHDKIDSEFYNLTIKKANHSSLIIIPIIKANDPWGAIRGVESFYQLIWSSHDDNRRLFVNETVIVDWPRFVHRGIMLDTARHYLPEVTILRVLTAMMYNKLNVFHFHIVDDQSWPFVSRKFPELAAKGAYNKAAIYSPEAIDRIVEAARVRGIRVILEFDTPGHVGALGKSHQELLTPCYGDGKTPGTPNYPEHAAYENLDPTNERVYEFMGEFYTEIVTNVSKDHFVHLGLDEVYAPCWSSSPVIKSFMKNQSYTHLGQVQEHYIRRLVAIVKNLNVTPIAWQDPLMAGAELDKDVVLQVWQDWGQNEWETFWGKALKKGFKLILSACWYINYIDYGETWRKYYECDPILNKANVTPNMHPQILGGEAVLWGEFVDQTNIIPRLFPFASAVAEVLWTNRSIIESTDKVKWRLDQFRCGLLRRGIQAQPILNGHCGPFETKPIS